MSWEQIAELHKDGFEVAHHTWTHKHAGKLTAPQLIEQLGWIENKITGFGAPRPVTFAYPGYATSAASINDAAFRVQRLDYAR